MKPSGIHYLVVQRLDASVEDPCVFDTGVFGQLTQIHDQDWATNLGAVIGNVSLQELQRIISLGGGPYVHVGLVQDKDRRRTVEITI